jgi:geranylgeranyl pyrophosphate synthase
VIDLASLLRLPRLGDDLARVETALQTSIEAGDPFLTEVAGHLISAGGKRLRPGLALAAASTADGADVTAASPDVVKGAVAVELVHLGSLYHDDVMDEAESRRGVTSVNARWGNLVAILAGDFLLARASEIAASLGTEVAGLLAATIGRLCTGQVREVRTTFDSTRTEAAYLASIADKTGALMAASCRIGGITAHLPRSHIEALTTYGQQIGMVFQIVDDILDVVATDEQLGKPAGNDLVEGVYTLPVIRALAAQQGDELRAVLGRRLERDEMVRARDMVRSDGAVAAAADVARAYTAEANALLDDLPTTPATDALRAFAIDLVDSVAARTN